MLDFAAEPNQQDLLSVSAKCTRDEYLGVILWRKFQSLQTRLRNDYNPHWNPIVRSGVHGIAEEEANYSAMLKIMWDQKEMKNHTQRVSTHPDRREVKIALNATLKSEALERLRQDSLAMITPFPGYAEWKPLDFHLFRLLGMGAEHRCLDSFRTAAKSTGPPLKTDSMSANELQEKIQAGRLSRKNARELSVAVAQENKREKRSHDDVALQHTLRISRKLELTTEYALLLEQHKMDMHTITQKLALHQRRHTLTPEIQSALDDELEKLLSNPPPSWDTYYDKHWVEESPVRSVSSTSVTSPITPVIGVNLEMDRDLAMTEIAAVEVIQEPHGVTFRQSLV